MTSPAPWIACLAALVLAGCAEDSTPQGICERRAYDDPRVKELMTLGAGSPWLLVENQEPLKRARLAAVNKCLEQYGVIRPGGVEMVVPPR